jgi:hypothetical protein
MGPLSSDFSSQFLNAATLLNLQKLQKQVIVRKERCNTYLPLTLCVVQELVQSTNGIQLLLTLLNKLLIYILPHYRWQHILHDNFLIFIQMCFKIGWVLSLYALPLPQLCSSWLDGCGCAGSAVSCGPPSSYFLS